MRLVVNFGRGHAKAEPNIKITLFDVFHNPYKIITKGTIIIERMYYILSGLTNARNGDSNIMIFVNSAPVY